MNLEGSIPRLRLSYTYWAPSNLRNTPTRIPLGRQTSMLALLLLLCFPLASPWTIDVHPDLSYPARWTAAPGDRYMSRNGTFLSPGYLNSCLNERVPQNVTRSKFHVFNGRAIFDLVNATQGNPTNESFHLDVYLPHLYYKWVDGPGGSEYNEGPKGKYKMGQTMWRYHYWQNFPKQGRCYLPLNMTEMVVDEDGKALRSEDLVGLNATLTFELCDARNYRTFEQVDQCAYVTLTDEDVQPVEDIPHCDSYNPISELAKNSQSSPPQSPGKKLERGRLIGLPGLVIALWMAV
ncbi:uncharacterized protein CC84DRAFT_1158985 [Paraphaeosphaeria sporulosa]|uniref:Uncharacterized protein n=1 Tax=Paraphaeosphaeria sporulosa TaxID=1460663 RepID=A0A177CV90_9PLEO|nr:uncharacterized protein CC84DRAFT_1158985 [Paraphaeosphaeria sporulosa]OAG11443.1 hypothetical protein CC84DRAFT_1158985 [Paraphaeosphaeria sporulosa]